MQRLAAVVAATLLSSVDITEATCAPIVAVGGEGKVCEDLRHAPGSPTPGIASAAECQTAVLSVCPDCLYFSYRTSNGACHRGSPADNPRCEAWKQSTGGADINVYEVCQAPTPPPTPAPPTPPAEYVLGDAGVDDCPDKFDSISDPDTCGIAAATLGVLYDESLNDGTSDAVCNLCGGCSPAVARVTSEHSFLAKWVCKALPTYAYGEKGEAECPDKYRPIIDSSTCEAASQFLGIADKYTPPDDIVEGAVCNGQRCNGPRGCKKVVVDSSRIKASGKMLCEVGPPLYAFGEPGETACPERYIEITNETACETAAALMGVPYAFGDNGEGAVCNGGQCLGPRGCKQATFGSSKIKKSGKVLCAFGGRRLGEAVDFAVGSEVQINHDKEAPNKLISAIIV